MSESRPIPPPSSPNGDRRILVISPVGCPPPNHGNRARLAALLKEMRVLGYEVHFAGVCIRAQEKDVTLPKVDQWVWDFTHRAPSGSAVGRLWATMKRKFRSLFYRLQLIEQSLDVRFENHWLDEAVALQARQRYARVLVVYVTYSKFFLAFPNPCLRILETQDVFANRRQRLRAKGISQYFHSISSRDETRGLLRAQRVIAIQAQEAAYFSRLTGGRTQVCTVGHFTEADGGISAPAQSSHLGCVGSDNPINRHGIRWFFQDVWPLIRARRPSFEIWIAGALSAAVEPGPGIHLLGSIHDLDSFYRDCPVLINPIQVGTGLKIKTVEALAHGRPIVTTSVGAEGLDAMRGHGILVCDTATEFAATSVTLLDDPAQARQLGETALQHIQKYSAESRLAFAEVLKI